MPLHLPGPSRSAPCPPAAAAAARAAGPGLKHRADLPAPPRPPWPHPAAPHTFRGGSRPPCTPPADRPGRRGTAPPPSCTAPAAAPRSAARCAPATAAAGRPRRRGAERWRAPGSLQQQGKEEARVRWAAAALAAAALAAALAAAGRRLHAAPGSPDARPSPGARLGSRMARRGPPSSELRPTRVQPLARDAPRGRRLVLRIRGQLHWHVLGAGAVAEPAAVLERSGSLERAARCRAPPAACWLGAGSRSLPEMGFPGRPGLCAHLHCQLSVCWRRVLLVQRCFAAAVAPNTIQAEVRTVLS